MEDHDHRFSLLRQRPGGLRQLQLVGDIQKGGGLVQQQHWGVLGQRHGQINLLSLSTGEVGHGHPLQPGHTGALHGLAGRLPVLPGVAAGIAQIGEAPVEDQAPRRDAGQRPALGKQRRQPGKLLGGEPGHVLPLYPYLSPFRCHQPGRHPQESGFSTARRPH